MYTYQVRPRCGSIIAGDNLHDLAPLLWKREIFGWTGSQEEGTSLRSLLGTDDLVANPWDLKDFQKLSLSMRAKGSVSFWVVDHLPQHADDYLPQMSVDHSENV